MRNMILVILAVSLSSCAVNDFIKKRDEAIQQGYIIDAQKHCKQYGFVEKTDAFAQCVQKDVNAANARDDARRNEINNTPSSTNTTCTNTITGMDCTTK